MNAGWWACGMIMDWGRGPYSSLMRLYPERPDILTRGTWRYTQPGALCLPVPHAFGSSRLRPNDVFDHPLIGEIHGSMGRAIPPYYSQSPGRRFCGDPYIWANGSPLSLQGSLPIGPLGVPSCCGAPRDAVFGGLQLGGLPFREVITEEEFVFGGYQLGGRAQFEGFGELEGDFLGGLEIGGTLSEVAYAVEPQQGGLLLGGAGLEASVAMESVFGGLQIGGEVLDASVGHESVFGGLDLGGEVLDASAGQETVFGGLAVGGTAASESFVAGGPTVLAGTPHGGSSPVSVSPPAGYVVGSKLFLLGYVAIQNGVNLVTPSGWSTVQDVNDMVNSFDATVWDKTAGSSEGSTTISNSSSPPDEVGGVEFDVSGVTLVASTANNGTSTAPTVLGTTLSGTNNLLVACFFWLESETFTPPSGFTQVVAPQHYGPSAPFDSVNFAVYKKSITGSGATGNFAASLSGSAAWQAIGLYFH